MHCRPICRLWGAPSPKMTPPHRLMPNKSESSGTPGSLCSGFFAFAAGFPQGSLARAAISLPQCLVGERGAKRVGVKSRNSSLSVASLTSASPSITLLGLAFYSVTAQREGTMKRFIAAAILGLTVVATVSTSASAFQCLARSSNGVATWGYGIFFSRASGFAIRHCRVAGGIDCHIAFCR
jgi:hypothetical protein